MADTQPSQPAAATTAGTEANSHKHRTGTDFTETHKERLPKKEQKQPLTNQARHPHEKQSRTTARHSDTSSRIISTREEKTCGGLIL